MAGVSDPLAKRNALRALVMNLSGGLAFALAIVWLHRKTGNIELQAMLTSPDKALVLLPAALLCFAGITKSAQLPFSSWLLGAMVAPTPVSALLHSSTMVKAGVYLVLRMAPLSKGLQAAIPEPVSRLLQVTWKKRQSVPTTLNRASGAQRWSVFPLR